MNKERVPFGIKYRADIDFGKYRVETRQGFPARIICWDLHDKYPIVAAVDYYGCEILRSFSADGKECRKYSEHDLFLVPVEQDIPTITGLITKDDVGNLLVKIPIPYLLEKNESIEVKLKIR